MNRVIINWKIISKGIKKGNRYSNDCLPSTEEIRKIYFIQIEELNQSF